MIGTPRHLPTIRFNSEDGLQVHPTPVPIADFSQAAHLAAMAQIQVRRILDQQDQWQALHTLALFAASGSSHPLDRQQYFDIKRYLADDILFKVDRMSMAVSLETRNPFLDYTLVEFAARLPARLRLHGLSTKYLLKRAMKSILPAQILHRRKLGFNTPYKNWLRNDWRGLLLDALSPAHLRRQGLFQPQYVQTLIYEHLKGERDHAHRLWQLLMFQLWAEHYLSRRDSGALLVEGRLRG